MRPLESLQRWVEAAPAGEIANYLFRINRQFGMRQSTVNAISSAVIDHLNEEKLSEVREAMGLIAGGGNCSERTLHE